MKFGALQRRVKRCEQVVTVRLGETQDHWSTLSDVWRKGWSPLRIVVVGLAGGFIAGKLEVPGKVNGARWLQMVGSVSNLFASAQAAFATAMAAQAAATADDAAEEADDASEQAQAAASAANARPAPAPARNPNRNRANRARPKPPPSCPNVDPRTPPRRSRPADNALPFPVGASMSESLLSPSPADPQGAEAPLPPPSRPRGPMSLVVLATLAVGYTLWAAQDIILPVLLAMFFALVGNPILRLLQKLWIPRALGALLILGAGLGLTGSLAVQLIGPAMEWAQEAPQQLRKVARQVQDLTKPVQQANQAAENFARVAGGDSNHKVQVIRTQLDDPYRMLTRAPRLAASVLAVVLLTLFFMIYGQSLQRAAIALFPNRQQQRFTTDILRSIEREVSRYVLTISVINSLVGLVFAGVLMLLGIGLQEALLWGTVAALLNFAPYVGPLIGVALMLLMGFVEFRDPLQALLPAAAYLGLHTLEGQMVTPIVLGRRMKLSPLVLILALMVFGWAWGMIGLLLAVPLLVCIKLVLARLDGMQGWARLLE